MGEEVFRRDFVPVWASPAGGHGQCPLWVATSAGQRNAWPIISSTAHVGRLLSPGGQSPESGSPQFRHREENVFVYVPMKKYSLHRGQVLNPTTAPVIVAMAM